jgi:type IV secretion system protein VirD4
MAKVNYTDIDSVNKSSINPGRLRLIGIIVGMPLLLLTSSITTQYLAALFGYQAALGEPIFSIGSMHIYQPFSWAVWYWKWRHYANEVVQGDFTKSYYILGFGCIISFCAGSYAKYRSTRNVQKPVEGLHGTAHFMSRDDVIKKSGLVGAGAGVYIGAYTDEETGITHYLRHDGPEHVIAFAPTRSGKGVGLVIPTLLSWPHSAFVNDIKGEAYAITAGWRKEKANNIIIKLEPTAIDGSSAQFNPLEEIRVGTMREVSDTQNIVNMIVDPDGKGLNDHWAKTGHALLVGAILHVLYVGKNKTLRGVADFLSDPTRDIHDTFNLMIGTEHDPSGEISEALDWRDSEHERTRIHPIVAASAKDMLNKSENEMSGVLSTAMSFLTLYRDPVVASNTSRSDFKIRDLMNADQPVTLYLVSPPSDKDRLKPFTRLVINQIMRTLTEEMKFENGRSVQGYKHRLLGLLDEFPALGKLDIMEEALAFVAGYGIKMYLITQDKSQLDKAYTKDESIFSNCHVRIAYAPNKIETAKMISEMLGKTTAYKQSITISGHRMKNMMDNMSTTVQESQRDLMTPDEVMRLRGPTKDKDGNIVDAGDMLIFIAGQAPIKGTQILYFRDPTFNDRSKIQTPLRSDSVRPRLPSTSTVEPPRSIPLKTVELTEEEKACASGIVLSRDPDSQHFFVSAPLVDEALMPDNPDDYVASPAPEAPVLAPVEEVPYATPIDDDDIELGEPMPTYDGEPVYEDDDSIDSTDVPDELVAAIASSHPVPAADVASATTVRVGDTATESAIEDLHATARKRRSAKPKSESATPTAEKPKAATKRAKKATATAAPAVPDIQPSVPATPPTAAPATDNLLASIIAASQQAASDFNDESSMFG